MIKIHCRHDALVDPKTLKASPNNPNAHSIEQARRLLQLYEYHGIRHPIIVSNLSGCIVAGHGRLMAALLGEMAEFPVVYQDFDSHDAEYAFLVSDNAVADWAHLDLSMINQYIPELELPSLDLLGIKDFNLDPPPQKTKKQKECPECGHLF